MRFQALVIIFSTVAFIAPSAISRIGSPSPVKSSRDTKQCLIKGNVSINTGERIYHVPGQKFYNPTKITPRYGERWFCTESEARSAGWRKARQ
ncbi:hypothetical protein [Hoeflea sp.]|uniref:sunset domain-containing protein n=1 Tax=Hoeflea sp. TaxID=1940281 RepID=UPI002AFEF50F|nr:hypothetical protein [Hoeflea sp.]